MKKVIYVSGLPRSGSTLLCQLLGHHDEIYSIGNTSPLSQIIENVRYNLSDNAAFLAELDSGFERVNERLLRLYRGIIQSWVDETELPCVVDKNRHWLGQVEMLQYFDPNFKMLVCVRDPLQIMGSIEKQHSLTRLIDFPDHISSHSVLSRAKSLFGDEGVVGAPMRFIEAMQDIENQEIRANIFYVSYEKLLEKPSEAMKSIFEWLSLPAHEIDFSSLSVTSNESDSHYRFKYPHRQYGSLKPIEAHDLPLRVTDFIRNKYQWFYEWFYSQEAETKPETSEQES